MDERHAATECTCEFPYPVGVWDGHHPNCALEQPPDNWCNCQAIQGTVTYPGPWHPKGDPVGCPRYGSELDMPAMWECADLTGGEADTSGGRS